MRSVWITWGWRGFGRTDAKETLFPEVRLGWLTIGWCAGALRDHIEAFRALARAARNKLGDQPAGTGNRPDPVRFP